MRAIDASKNGFADPAWDTSNPLISPENSSHAARVRQHWARTRAGLVSTAFQHTTLGSRRRNLALDAAVNHLDDPSNGAPRMQCVHGGRSGPDRPTVEKCPCAAATERTVPRVKAPTCE